PLLFFTYPPTTQPATLSLHDALPISGALIAGVSWQLITIGFSIYVANFSNYTATYGSLGGIIVLMIWFFLTGIILMVGALINVTYHHKQIRKDPKLHKAANI